MARSLRQKSSSQQFLVDVEITQDDLRDLVRAINKHGSKKALTKELRTGLREALKPTIPEARQSVKRQSVKRSNRALAVTGQRGQAMKANLRDDLARAVEVKVDLGIKSGRIGARLRLDGRRMVLHPRSLIPYYEGVKPWRHPVFGNRKVWVQQPHRGFLTEVADKHRPRIVHEIEAVMNGVGKKIDGGH